MYLRREPLLLIAMLEVFPQAEAFTNGICSNRDLVLRIEMLCCVEWFNNHYPLPDSGDKPTRYLAAITAVSTAHQMRLERLPASGT